ncbi:MAG: hypothetical protein NZ898_16465, partial [Myxococcota bacterium]|nr:hypothetical protein [Myxococcota bacterium]
PGFDSVQSVGAAAIQRALAGSDRSGALAAPSAVETGASSTLMSVCAQAGFVAMASKVLGKAAPLLAFVPIAIELLVRIFGDDREEELKEAARRAREEMQREQEQLRAMQNYLEITLRDGVRRGLEQMGQTLLAEIARVIVGRLRVHQAQWAEQRAVERAVRERIEALGRLRDEAQEVVRLLRAV